MGKLLIWKNLYRFPMEIVTFLHILDRYFDTHMRHRNDVVLGKKDNHFLLLVVKIIKKNVSNGN